MTNDKITIEELVRENRVMSEEIIELLSESKSNSGLIENFIKRVEKREAQLETQEIFTESYSQKLKEFSSERESLLDEAKALIASAKIALEYKTAEGISAAFIEKYSEAKEDDSLKYWIYGAGGFIIIALCVGVWILSGKTPDYRVILGRISLLPMLVAGAWFCASQYVKQINLREDYAYKSVLAKSIVGFSEQFKGKQDNGEEYTHYIKSVLEEIHKDPLRKRTKDAETPSEIKEDIKSLVRDSKIIKDITKHITKPSTTENT